MLLKQPHPLFSILRAVRGISAVHDKESEMHRHFPRATAAPVD